MKAALRAKKRAGKEREALIDRFGIDSITANKEQLEAEAKEAELEGRKRVPGSKLLSASFSVAS